MFPSLDLIWLGSTGTFLEKFIAARRLSDLPVAVANTLQEIYNRLDSYAGRWENIPYQLRTISFGVSNHQRF